jgi:pimeloyl-ACP methyl ester carboxylesterase
VLINDVHQLMERLGYTEYVAQGGDWGSAITTEIAMQAPQHCRAIHINFLPTGPPSDKGASVPLPSCSSHRMLGLSPHQSGPSVRIGMLASLKLGLSYLFPSWFYTPREIHNIREVFSVLLEESGYHPPPLSPKEWWLGARVADGHMVFSQVSSPAGDQATHGRICAERFAGGSRSLHR